MYDICVRNSLKYSPESFVSTVARADFPWFLFEFLFKFSSFFLCLFWSISLTQCDLKG